MTPDESISIPVKPKRRSRQQKNKRERLFMILTVGLIAAAWLFGYFTSGADVAPLVPEVLPGINSIETQGALYVGYDANGELVGYAAVGAASGYGGPIEMLVGVDPDGEILGSTIVAERESPGFFRLVESSGLIEGYAGLAITDPLQLDEDLDAVSGATVSAEGVAKSVRTAVQEIAANGLDSPLPPEKQSIKFGIPEIVLILLFVTGFIAHRMRSRVWKKRIRWNIVDRYGGARFYLHCPLYDYDGSVFVERLLARLAHQSLLVHSHWRYHICHHYRCTKSILLLVLSFWCGAAVYSYYHRGKTIPTTRL